MSIFNRAPHTPSICSISERVLKEIQDGDGDGDSFGWTNTLEEINETNRVDVDVDVIVDGSTLCPSLSDVVETVGYEPPNEHLHKDTLPPHTNYVREDKYTRAPLNRLVVRDMPFHQSSNSLRTRHQFTAPLRNFQGPGFFYRADWFHICLHLRTEISLLFLVALWTSVILIYACLYMYVDDHYVGVSCGLSSTDVDEGISFNGAFAFSLETATTVGYGLPNGGNSFFENCPQLQVVIYFQMVTTMFLNAFIFSFVYSRMSRSETRATQVLFSEKATLNREVLPNGIVRYALSVRIYDADSMYPLMEAHVRFYAVKHAAMHAPNNEGVLFPIKMEPMRVSIPDDNLGAALYTSIPMTATHHIDFHSPINPPGRRAAGPEDGRVNPTSAFAMDYCGLNLREEDAYTNGRDGLRCAICGETYATVANLVQHIRYYQFCERHDKFPIIGSHQELDVEALFKKWVPKSIIPKAGDGGAENTAQATAADRGRTGHVPSHTTCPIDIDHTSSDPYFDEFRRYYDRANVEIICVVEAIDPILSGTFHAVQSYTIDDIVFNSEFAPCVLADGGAKTWTSGLLVHRSSARCCSMKVDLDSFHKTVSMSRGNDKRWYLNKTQTKRMMSCQ